jgi:hypothetical protein
MIFFLAAVMFSLSWFAFAAGGVWMMQRCYFVRGDEWGRHENIWWLAHILTGPLGFAASAMTLIDMEKFGRLK